MALSRLCMFLQTESASKPEDTSRGGSGGGRSRNTLRRVSPREAVWLGGPTYRDGASAPVSSPLYRSVDVAMGGGGPAKRTCRFILAAGEGVRSALWSWAGSGQSRDCSGRGESSARSYSLGLLRSERLELKSGSDGPSPRESESRGRKDAAD